MGKRIENFIDNSLENIAPFLYICSIVGGILLIILGFMMIKNKTMPNNKIKKLSIISICLGLLAAVSGLIQYIL